METETPVNAELVNTAQDVERLKELESAIRSGLSSFVTVGNALIEIREKRLYKDKYTTFEDYCETVWDMTSRRCRQLADAAKVMENLNNCSDLSVKPQTESQVRPLVGFDDKRQIAVWKKGCAKVLEGTVPTAKIIEGLVGKKAKSAQKAVPPEPATTPATPIPEGSPVVPAAPVTAPETTLGVTGNMICLPVEIVRFWRTNLHQDAVAEYDKLLEKYPESLAQVIADL